ncbi:MAG: hypothetical protein ACXWUH_08120 [Burkholderiales bacterium]
MEPRVVDRPAPRFTFPTEPLVAIRGGARSLPMWLYWKVEIEGLDPPTLEAWLLGSIEIDPGATANDGEVLASCSVAAPPVVSAAAGCRRESDAAQVAGP